MDIWQWVVDAQSDLYAAGHDRLADLMIELPRRVVSGDHQAAEALLPEALALARSIDHAWIEVYLRHWIAQSRVLHRHDVTRGMDDLIHLLDSAHEERTRECPQSVCVVQDVCAAYGVIDGPGYVNERLAVSTEALARIDPTWQCFECITCEHADALLDAGRYEDAERYVRTQLAVAARHDNDIYWDLRFHLVEALSRQGRHEEAAQLLEPPIHMGENRHKEVDYKLRKGRELALLGRIEEAKRYAVPLRNIASGDYLLWARASAAFCAAGAKTNDRRLDKTLRGFVTTLISNGALYEPAEVALIAARLALARGDDREAAQYLDEVETLAPRLRSPERIVAVVQELRAAIVRRVRT